MFIHGYDGINKNKHHVDITIDLTWQYDGPKGDVEARPERVYNAALRDIANLMEDILSGDKATLKYFETEAPGNRRAWSMFLMKRGENPLATNNQRLPIANFSDNMKYNTIEKREFLAEQLKKNLAKIFSRKNLLFEDIIPKTVLNSYNVKYGELKNVNKNQNSSGKTMTFNQMKQEAATDVDKIKDYVLKAYEKMTPVVNNEYGTLALENNKQWTLKSIPTVSKLAKARFEKASLINAIQKQNPIMRAASKATIIKSPSGARDGFVSRLVEYEKIQKRDKALGGKMDP